MRSPERPWRVAGGPVRTDLVGPAGRRRVVELAERAVAHREAESPLELVVAVGLADSHFRHDHRHDALKERILTSLEGIPRNLM